MNNIGEILKEIEKNKIALKEQSFTMLIEIQKNLLNV